MGGGASSGSNPAQGSYSIVGTQALFANEEMSMYYSANMWVQPSLVMLLMLLLSCFFSLTNGILIITATYSLMIHLSIHPDTI